MTETEQYEFDRQGFLVLRNFLTGEEVSRLRLAIDSLEQHAMEHYQLEPRKSGNFGSEYHLNAERGYHVTGATNTARHSLLKTFSISIRRSISSSTIPRPIPIFPALCRKKSASTTPSCAYDIPAIAAVPMAGDIAEVTNTATR